jgi:hypothetical protein
LRVSVHVACAPISRLAGAHEIAVSVGGATRPRDTLREVPFSVAVNTTVLSVLTRAADAVKDALVAPPATSTDAGAATDASLVTRETAIPPAYAGTVSVTVQREFPGTLTVPGLHESPESCGRTMVIKPPVANTGIPDPSADAPIGFAMSSTGELLTVVGESVRVTV